MSAASERTVDVHVTYPRESGEVCDNSRVATQVISPVIDAEVQRAVGTPLNGLQGPAERPGCIRRKPLMESISLRASEPTRVLPSH